jgi:hypothetical protein
MIITIDDVPHVVHVAGDGGKLGLVFPLAQANHDVVSDAGRQAGVPVTVLGVADSLQRLVGLIDQLLNLLVFFDLFDRNHLGNPLTTAKRNNNLQPPPCQEVDVDIIVSVQVA